MPKQEMGKKKWEVFKKGIQSCQGSMTVEAALLIPLLVYLLLAVIYLDFWQYDCTVAQALCSQTVWQLQYEEKEAEPLSDRLTEKLRQVLLTDALEDGMCKHTLLYSQAECGLRMKIPLSGVKELLGNTAGYETTCRGVVSSVVTSTVFRKMSGFSKGEEET